jgi:multiple sugar transport system permease protein
MVVVLAAVSLYPMLWSLKASFTQATLYQPNAPWAGLSNYVGVLSSSLFWQSLWFNLRFTVVSVFVEGVLGTAIALVLSEAWQGRKLLVLLLLPLMVAPVFYSLIFELLTNSLYGPLIYYLHALGFRNVGINSPTSAFVWLVVTDVVQWTPFVAVVVFAGLQTADRETVDAAWVDGAGVWGTFRHVVLPSLRPYVVLAAILRMMDTFKVFATPLVLTGGGPGTATESLTMYLQQLAFQQFNLAQTAAATVILAVVLSAFTTVVVRLFYRRAPQGGAV